MIREELLLLIERLAVVLLHVLLKEDDDVLGSILDGLKRPHEAMVVVGDVRVFEPPWMTYANSRELEEESSAPEERLVVVPDLLRDVLEDLGNELRLAPDLLEERPTH